MPDLSNHNTDNVPIVYADGVWAFRHHVTPEEFTAYVRGGARPASSLANDKCVPCRGDVPPLKGDELTALARELGNGWRAVEEHHLEKEYAFPDFAQALAFTTRGAAVAG